MISKHSKFKAFIEKNTYSQIDENNKYLGGYKIKFDREEQKYFSFLDKKLSEIKENLSDSSIDISAVKMYEKPQETTICQAKPVQIEEEAKNLKIENIRRKFKSSLSESSSRGRSRKRNKSQSETY